jgi:hypothetical protein
MSAKEDAIVDQYCTLMGEVRVRLDLVNNCLAGQYGLPVPAARELCYLQFRMICELIALCGITAHGHLASKEMRDSWSAESIIKSLAESHPRFYPRPILRSKPKPPATFAFSLRKRADYLTQKEMVALIPKCGAVLHRGSMKNYQKRKPVKNAFADIRDIGQKILNLVNSHQITMLNPGKLYVCEFLPDGTVQTFAIERLGNIPLS